MTKMRLSLLLPRFVQCFCFNKKYFIVTDRNDKTDTNSSYKVVDSTNCIIITNTNYKTSQALVY